MNRYCLPGVIVLAFLPVNVFGGEPTWSPKAAAEYLDGRAEFWAKWGGAARGQGTACISCHTTLSFALARPALGGKDASAGEKTLLDGVRKRVANWDKIVAEPNGKDPFVPYYPKNRKPSALGTEAVLNALVLVRADARYLKGMLSAPTKAALGHLWEQQQANGAWLWLDFGLNPWESNGAYYGTSLAALAVGTAGPSYFEQADIEPKVAALKKYLTTQAKDQPLHHRVVGLWASSMLPGILSEQDKSKLIDELLAAQQPDGGWALAKLGKKWASYGGFPDGTVSDGYAAGLAVLALKRAKVPSDHPKLRKGVAWLLNSQRDGTWPATYINKPRNPQDNVGKFMRDAATAFAVLALSEPEWAAGKK